MRKLILLLLVITAAAAGGAYCDVPPVNQFLVWYLGNVLPTAPNSAGPGVSFGKFPKEVGPINGVVVNDVAAIDGKALFINDNSITDMVYYRSGYDLLDNATGVTIVGRVKVISDVHGASDEAGGNLQITDKSFGGGLVSDYHWGGPGNDIRECTRETGSVGAAGDGLYHTLRMTAKGSQFGDDVPLTEPFTYSDGKLVGKGADPYFWLGDADAAEIKVVSNTVLVTGGNKDRDATYYVICAPDAGKITFEFDIQGTATAAGDIYDVAISSDPSVPCVHGELALWVGGATAIRGWNYPALVATPAATLTGGGSWDHCKVVVQPASNLATFYFTPSGGAETTLGTQQIYCSELDTVYYININHYDSDGDPDLTGSMAYFDNFTLNGVAVALTNPRTIKLYLDESLVRTISPAPPYSTYPAANNFLGFGSDSTAAQQEVYFDWVTASNRGAFAPGEEVAVLGHSLIPGATASCTTLDQVKASLAPPGSVNIASAIVTGSFTNNLTGNAQPVGFAIEKPNRESGIRVVQDPVSLPLACPKGADVSILGFAQTVGGERVIACSGVTINDYGDPDDAPKPLAMNQRSSGGGQFGGQPPVWNIGSVTTTPLFADSFTYPDGDLVGNGGWTGNTTSGTMILIASNEVKIKGGQSVRYATHAVPSDPGADAFKTTVMIRQGDGTSTIWQFGTYDSAGTPVLLAEWYGGGNWARPRIGGTQLAKITLTGATTWDTLGIKYTFAGDKAEYFFNNVSQGTIVGATGAGDTLASVRFTRSGSSSNNVYFDDLTIDGLTFGSPAVGLSNVGLLVTVFGKITEITPTDPNDPNGVFGWFRIEDGSGINLTETGAGIKCRVPEDDAYMSFPPVAVGDYVEATGILGLDGGIRFLWTTAYNKY